MAHRPSEAPAAVSALRKQDRTDIERGYPRRGPSHGPGDDASPWRTLCPPPANGQERDGRPCEFAGCQAGLDGRQDEILSTHGRIFSTWDGQGLRPPLIRFPLPHRSGAYGRCQSNSVTSGQAQRSPKDRRTTAHRTTQPVETPAWLHPDGQYRPGTMPPVPPPARDLRGRFRVVLPDPDPSAYALTRVPARTNAGPDKHSVSS
jgi:hypothetical protein